MSAELEGVRVLIVTSNAGVEHDELVVPRDRLRERGAQVRHAAMKGEAVQTYRHDLEPAEQVQPDVTLDSVVADEVDVLVIPGGTVNADTLRTDDRARELVRAQTSAKKPIAAICHGPWLLVDAGVLPGKTLTSYPSLRIDIVNAGGHWVDQSKMRCAQNGWTLITSRKPDDLPDFVDAITAEFAG
ncbi:type 1 glutamine amidotransferase domain-containing protein [Nocardia blacklockiae]|uniref:type 1 glutamine amidotransferase domain-containing protein n=1 Tax=Nocardia blacklockiae TaxID=480036 RepID=UPI0018932A3E|nr:type 1 glutamine amidotransferase domain-containing protein [Nocardia blacklockiae]MBF6172000.1 type 1 glutamine amidotransferase [Nocardia blacklockiae]